MNKKLVMLLSISILMLFPLLCMYITRPASGVEGFTEPIYLGIADYYDNRNAVVTVTTDDWKQYTWQEFEFMSQMLTAKRIYFTGAIITNSANWTQIQYWLDLGYAEAASHSRSHPNAIPYIDYNSEIVGSKQDITANLTLPDTFSYSGNEYVYSWIEPYSTSDSIIRQKLGECKYLADRSVAIDDNWAQWDSTNNLFDRNGFSIRMENNYVTDVATLNSRFDEVYATGQIYHLMTHPRNTNWETGQYADLHTSYISNRNDIWYVNYGPLYLYHWIDSQNIVEVTSTGSSQDKIFKINMSSTDRQNYGAKYPITYVFDIPPSWTNAYVAYRFNEFDAWTILQTKTSSDFFNGIDTVRFDYLNNKAYVSVGFDELSNEIYLKILPQGTSTAPVADFTATPTTGTEPLQVNFTDLSTSYDGIIGWIWNFGDGYFSASQNPIHTYVVNGADPVVSYSVELRVFEEDGDEDIKTKTYYITLADAVPTADFTYSQASAPSTVIFTDQSTSYDEIVSWLWDFGDGKTSTQKNPTHKFPPHPRTFNITLHVTDADGSVDASTKLISISNSPPTAEFEIVSSDKPTVNEQIYFVDHSLDLDGEVVSWFWNLGDETTSTSQNITHKYQTLGNYTITLTITDDEGATDTTSKDMTIFDIIQPTTTHNYDGMWHKTDFNIILTATDDLSGVQETFYKINDGSIRTISIHGQPLITANGADNKLEYWSVDNSGNEETHHIVWEIKLDKTQPTAVAGQDQFVNEDSVVIFDGSLSSDNIEITSYKWLFLDETPQTLTGANTSYIFNTPGVFDVVLSVTDAALNNAMDTVVITVIDTTEPVADAGDDKVVKENIEVMFDGQGSTDNVEIMSYIWTFFDVTPKTLYGENPIYVFDNPGVYEVTLTVSDEQGNSATDVVTFTIIDSTWPVADAGPDQIVDDGTIVNFDGSASNDNVGITSYVWTFTDETPQILFTVHPSYTFETPGLYIVTLTITDAEEHFTTDTVLITVRDATPPVIDPGNYTAVVENAAITFDASKSYDNVGISYYQWDFGDGTVENDTTPLTTHTYTKSGFYLLKLTLADQTGNINSTLISINVHRDNDRDLLADYLDSDDDNDGMPDDWEILYKLDPLDPSDASQDPDGDGLQNLWEYQRKSNPNIYTSSEPFSLADLVAVIIIFVILLPVLIIRRLGR